MAQVTVPADARAHAPWHLSIVGALALLWNGLGAFDYLMKATANPAYLASYNEQQRAYFAALPATLEGFWAIGACAALLGSLLLIFRNGLAPLAFALSILGLLGSTLYEFAVLNPPAEVMTWSMMAMTIVAWLIAVVLFHYSRTVKQLGLIGI